MTADIIPFPVSIAAPPVMPRYDVIPVIQALGRDGLPMRPGDPVRLKYAEGTVDGWIMSLGTVLADTGHRTYCVRRVDGITTLTTPPFMEAR